MQLYVAELCRQTAEFAAFCAKMRIAAGKNGSKLLRAATTIRQMAPRVEVAAGYLRSKRTLSFSPGFTS